MFVVVSVNKNASTSTTFSTFDSNCVTFIIIRVSLSVVVEAPDSQSGKPDSIPVSDRQPGRN